MRTRPAILTLCLAASVHGQISVDKPILLVSPDDDQRQVTGLPASQLAGDLLSAGVEQQGVHRFAQATAGATWHVDLPGLDQAPEPGTAIVVAAPAGAQGEVFLSLNGTGPYPVRLGPDLPVIADHLPAGILLSLVFDGQAFQLMNGTAHTRRECPAGMVAVNELLCIEQSERPAANFLEASLVCGSLGRRMCSWGELHVACLRRDELGMAPMIGYNEWTNSTADHDMYVRIRQSGCNGTARQHAINVSIAYRCCYTR